MRALLVDALRLRAQFVLVDVFEDGLDGEHPTHLGMFISGKCHLHALVVIKGRLPHRYNTLVLLLNEVDAFLA